MTQSTMTPEQEAQNTIEDAIIELRAVQTNTDSKMHYGELEDLINRMLDLYAEFEYGKFMKDPDE